ncbi:MAG: hypothetical protein AAB407_04050 [Patescibacteria group bacterium]
MTQYLKGFIAIMVFFAIIIIFANHGNDIAGGFEAGIDKVMEYIPELRPL